jgi:hypothetical protein
MASEKNGIEEMVVNLYFGIQYGSLRKENWERLKSMATVERVPLAQAVAAYVYCNELVGVVGKDMSKGLIFARCCKKWLTESAENSPYAHSVLSCTFAYAGCRLDRNPAKAIELFHQSATAGFSASQCRLAELYMSGSGVDKDPEQGFNWCRLAAEQGNACAQCMLGECYMTGNAVEHNPPVAVSLFLESSDQGHVDATCKYAKCIMEGIGCDKNPVKAYQLFSQTAEQGSSEALFHLAHCHQRGIGTRKTLHCPSNFTNRLQIGAIHTLL